MSDLHHDELPATAGFQSFFLGGFECATQRRADGVRLDLLASTGHDRFAREDYERLAALGVSAVRDGVRWHAIEKAPGLYDWSGVLPMAKAAAATGTQVIWDLCHYGYPDGLDIWSPAFPERFARFARECARVIGDQGDAIPYYCPVNEMSFWAWAGGDMAKFNPTTRGRAGELKRQLARAAIAAVDAVRSVDPRARFICAEPNIHVAPNGGSAQAAIDAENYRVSQFEAHDMLIGRREPELGGAPDKLDIVGANFYPDNQWTLGTGAVPMGHYDYRPLRDMLAELAERYGRPVFVSETGAEGTARPAWLHYVAGEVAAARDAGVQVEGICLYPILDYPGWENDRHCDVGLFGAACDRGTRTEYAPLAAEMRRHQERFAAAAADIAPLRREAFA